jgi:ureidoacrylate peracid hydrolase
MNGGFMEKNLKKLLAERLRNTQTALIVVDVQNDFCHSQGAISKRNVDLTDVRKNVVPTLISFIGKCRESGMPVVFVRTIHTDWTNSPSWLGRMGGTVGKLPICEANSHGSEFYGVEPRAGDHIVTKHRYSGFVGTDLDMVLRSRGTETLLFTGVATNVCVETTARDGFNLNYHVIFVEDCCGAFSPEEHSSALTNISKYFGIVSDSKTITKIMKENR